jgi:hypothetical protein
MAGATKLMTAGGGGVNITPASSIASDVTVQVPSVNDTLVGLAATQTLTNKTIQGGTVISGTAVNASGTSVDFTGIPSWVKRVTVMFNAVSTTGTSGIRVRLGYGSTTYVTTGYNAYGGQISGSTAALTNATDGFIIGMTTAAAQANWSSIVITQINTNLWTFAATSSGDTPIAGWAAGNLNLSGNVLTAIRVTTTGGTDTFDNGSINILYE